jgi:threonine aldolase
VGDDVYGEDPTVNLLERRAAERFGREAALFVPTGTMGNQIAIRLHTQPGQEVIAESRAHILDYEMATAAVFSGCLIRAVAAESGTLTWKQIEPAIYARGAFRLGRRSASSPRIWTGRASSMRPPRWASMCGY